MKILIVGLGSIGQRHARNLRTLLGDSVELLAYRVRGLAHAITPAMCCDKTADFAKENSIRVFFDLQKALKERPEIAFICNPSSMHLPAALQCIRGGCDLFIEKPISNSMNRIDELIGAAEKSKCIVMVGYQMRFHPCIRELTKVLGRGLIGNVLAVRATVGEYLPDWHPYEDYRDSYAARAELGGGVVVTQIHELDYLYSLFGLPRRVYALGGHWSELEVNVEDTASALMECEIDGRPLPIHLHQDYLQSPPSRQCEVIGDRGRVVTDLLANTITIHERSNSTPTVQDFSTLERNQLFLCQTQHMLDCVRTRSRPVVDLHDGAQSLRMALAIKDSITSRQPVNLI